MEDHNDFEKLIDQLKKKLDNNSEHGGLKELLDKLIKKLYALQREYANDKELQELVEMIKFLRRSKGHLQSWNQRYVDENEDLEGNIEEQTRINESLEQELTRAQGKIEQMIVEQKQLTQEREKIIIELRQIDQEVKATQARVKSATSLHGKLSIVWQFLQSTFFSDDPQDFGKIERSVDDDDYNLPPGAGVIDPNRKPDDDGNKPWMKTDRASVQRDLLDH